MRVLYDASPLLMHSAGVKNYHYALLERLTAEIPRERLSIYPYLSGISENFNEGSNFSRFYTAARLAGLLAENHLGAPFAHPQASRADLFHITPHAYRPPRWPVLTSMIHDATPVTHADCHQSATIALFHRFVEKTVPRLAAVIAPSEAVKQDLVSQVGLHSLKIEVIQHGVDEDFFDSSPEQRATARRKYSLPDEYVLFVGSMEPRKNLVRLAEAHSMLPEPLQARYPLVIVGSAGWHNDEIRSTLRKSRHVQKVGYVSRQLLPAVYACASVFVFPSLYEGFGMPLLEAMAAGVPVVTSDVSALPEVLGGCGATVDPYDVEALSETLRGRLEDPHAAAETAARARDRARGFTWERCARQTWEFFERASA